MQSPSFFLNCRKAALLLLAMLLSLSVADLRAQADTRRTAGPTADSSTDLGVESHVVPGRLFPAGFLPNNQLLSNPTSQVAAAEVQYLAMFEHVQVFVRPTGISHVLARPQTKTPQENLLSGSIDLEDAEVISAARAHELFRVDIDLLGANIFAEAQAQKPGKAVLRRNGNPASKGYARLRLPQVYAGVDYVLDATAKSLKSEFHVQPFSDPTAIALEISGADNVEIAPDGSLIITTPLGEIREHAPLAFQPIDDLALGDVFDPAAGAQVACRFVLDGNIVRFELGEFDRSRLLVIDPLVEWKTLFGGNREDVLRELRCDDSDNLLVTGYTGSLDFPASVGQLTLAGGTDCFVAELTPAGTLIWATLLGGADADRGVALTTDSQGEITIVGSTLSDDFPRSLNSAPRSFNEDAFVAQLAPDGSLNWSVLLAGNATEFALDVSTAANDFACVVGVTNSTDLPTSVGQLARAGSFDGFIAAFDLSGNLDWAAYIGGSAVDQCFAITRDGNDFIIGGQTRSTDFPVTGGQTVLGGDYDGFVARIAADGTPDWSTFLGGRSLDGVQDLTMAADGGIIAVGFTASPDFGADRGKICLSAEDVFIAKMRPTGTVEWKTLFGGNAGEPNGATIGLRFGPSVSTASDGSIYLAGATASTDLPAGIGQTQLAGDEDLYLAQFCADGGLEWSTYCGSTGKERGFGLALDSRDQVYFGGWTNGTTFPVTQGRTQILGGSDIVLGKATAIDTCAFTLSVEPAELLEICEGESMMARAVTADCYVLDNFRWVDLSDGSIVARGAEFSALNAGEYEVRASSPCECDVVGKLRVIVNPAPSIVELRDTVFCRDGNAVRLEPSVEADAGPLQYSWSPEAGLSNPNIRQPFAFPDVATTYLLRVEDRNGCVATSTVRVAVDDSPTVNIVGDTLKICAGETSAVELLNLDSDLETFWTPSLLVDNQTARRPNARGLGNGWLYLEARNPAGCVKRDSIYIQTIDPDVSLDVSELDFGVLGDCSDGEVLRARLRNDGVVDVMLNTLRLNSAEFSVVEPAVLPQSIAPGATIEIAIRYSPNATGEHTARLIIEAGPCDITLQVRVRGRRDDLALAVAPAELDFGQLLLCEQADGNLTLTLRNEAATDVRIDGLSVPAPFSLTSDAVPFNIAPGASVQVNVLAALQQEAGAQADLTIEFSNGDCDAVRTVKVLASAAAPRLEIGATEYDLGILGECELSRDSTITLTNRGAIPLTDIRYNPAPGLAVIGTVPASLAPGESADVAVRISAAAPGVTLAVMQFLYEPCTSSTLSSVRIERGTGGLELPGLIDFGLIEFCPPTTATQALLLVNNGAGTAVTITDINVPTPFSLTPNLPIVLAAGEDLSLPLRFTPMVAGAVTADIELTIEDCEEPLRVALQARSAVYTLDAADLDFGGLLEGRALSRELIVTNTSAEPLRIEAVDLPASAFQIVNISPALPFELPPGAELRLEVLFTAGVDEAAAVLTFLTQSECIEDDVVTLRGRGIPRTVTSSTIAVPDLQRSVYDRAVRVPVFITDFTPATTARLAYTAELRFNASVFNPLAALDADMQLRRDGQDVFVQLSGEVEGVQSGDTLTWLIGDVLLGNTAESTIAIVQFDWSDAEIATQSSNGSLRLLELCERGDGTRLLNYVDQYGIHIVHPHPVRGAVEVLVRTLETAPTHFDVVDVSGRVIKSEQWLPSVVGQWFHVRYTDLASGAYSLILRSPARVTSERLLIID